MNPGVSIGNCKTGHIHFDRIASDVEILVFLCVPVCVYARARVCVCETERKREHAFTWWGRGLNYRTTGYTFDIVMHFGCRRTDTLLQELDLHMRGDKIFTDEIPTS